MQRRPLGVNLARGACGGATGSNHAAVDEKAGRFNGLGAAWRQLMDGKRVRRPCRAISGVWAWLAGLQKGRSPRGGRPPRWCVGAMAGGPGKCVLEVQKRDEMT
jgi:hypothetical protein